MNYSLHFNQPSDANLNVKIPNFLFFQAIIDIFIGTFVLQLWSGCKKGFTIQQLISMKSFNITLYLNNLLQMPNNHSLFLNPHFAALVYSCQVGELSDSNLF